MRAVFASVLLCFASATMAEQLSIDRIFGGGGLTGPRR